MKHPSTDPARAWASLYRLCRTYEQKLKEVSLKEVNIKYNLSIIYLYSVQVEKSHIIGDSIHTTLFLKSGGSSQLRQTIIKSLTTLYNMSSGFDMIEGMW